MKVYKMNDEELRAVIHIVNDAPWMYKNFSYLLKNADTVLENGREYTIDRTYEVTLDIADNNLGGELTKKDIMKRYKESKKYTNVHGWN